MADLAVIVPTRERVERFRQLAEAVEATAAGEVELVACVDDDDPQLELYRPIVRAAGRLLIGRRQSLSRWTNFAAQWVLNPANGPVPRYLASMGDDHLPRTYGWDKTLAQACDPIGWAYGDDGYQGGRLPTAWVQSTELARRLGWMMLPACEHLYVDNVVLKLGQATGMIRYLPEVLIEHMHPVAGKAEQDDSYQASNSRQRYREDAAAFRDWLRGGLAADVRRVRGEPA